MISDENKKKIEKSMKNVEVVKKKRKLGGENIDKQPGKSVTDLRKKYLPGESQDKIKKLRKKFLSDAKETEKKKDHENETDAASDDDIEVGLIRKKEQDAGEDKVDERTIIISKKDGIMGAQG